MIRAVLVASAALAMLPAAAAAVPACLSDSDAREEVRSHRLMSVQRAIATARQKVKGELISAHLCRLPAGFVYRIAILGRDGRVDRVLVNADGGHLSE